MATLGIPLCFTDSDIYLLHPNPLRQMSDDEIKELLGRKVITDAESAAYIQTRGFDLGLQICEADVIERLVMKEEYTDYPLRRGN